MDNRVKISALFLFLFIALVVSYWQGWAPGDNERLAGWLIAGEDENFLFPMLYYVTKPIYEIIGPSTFYILPFIWLFGGFFILAELFKEFKLPQEVILLSFATTLFSINFLGYFMRDSLMFFLACIFAYFFFRIRYKNMFCWYNMLLLLPIMVLTREMGIVFLAFFVILGITKIPRAWLKKITLPLGNAAFWTSTKWNENLIRLIRIGWDNLMVFRWQSFQLPNPVYWISIIAIFVTRDAFHMVLIIATLIVAFVMGGSLIWECCIFRYTYSLMPLHIFYLGVAVQKYKWLYFPLVLGAAAGVFKLVITILGPI